MKEIYVSYINSGNDLIRNEINTGTMYPNK
jgi:hypothetical protein